MVAFLGHDGAFWLTTALTIERVAGKLQTDGRIARGYIGLGLQAAKLDGDGGIGSMVMIVDPTGARGRRRCAAGRRPPSIGMASAFATCELASQRRLGPTAFFGQVARLSLLRGGEPIEVALTIAERPES